MAVGWCNIEDHDWGQFLDGTLIDENGWLIEKCKICGYQSDWIVK